MKIFKYFDLGLFPEEAELGSKKPSAKKRRNFKRFLTTCLVYTFVWLGILGQRIMELQQAGTTISWSNLGQGFPFVALIIATAIFPVVFPKTFLKIPAKAQKAGDIWFFVQLCVAFQNGFFLAGTFGFDHSQIVFVLSGFIFRLVDKYSGSDENWNERSLKISIVIGIIALLQSVVDKKSKDMKVIDQPLHEDSRK